MVDEGRVARLLRGVDDRVQRLDAERDADPTRRADALWLDAIKYLFITTIEGCIDVAHHVVASERWAAPDTNAGAFRSLGDHGILDRSTAETMAMAAGFRNVLVHQYTAIDDGRVVAALDDLDDLRRFVRQVSNWMNDQRGDRPGWR